MVDILDIISRLKTDLWNKYGNVLDKKYDQNEIHMTYYVSTLLEKSGHKLSEDYRYTEEAANAAFIAGLRVGKMDAKVHADEIVKDRLYSAISVLKGEYDA